MALAEDVVREGIRCVVDREIAISVVDLGLVRKMTASGDGTQVTIAILPIADCLLPIAYRRLSCLC